MFNRLNNKWQYIAQLYESGGMDEENTDTQVSVLCEVICVCTMYICSVNPLNPVLFYEILHGSTRKEVRGGCRKLHNEILPNLYSTPDYFGN